MQCPLVVLQHDPPSAALSQCLTECVKVVSCPNMTLASLGKVLMNQCNSMESLASSIAQFDPSSLYGKRGAAGRDFLALGRPAGGSGGEEEKTAIRRGAGRCRSDGRPPVLFLRPANCIRDVRWLSLSDKAGSAIAHASAQRRSRKRRRRRPGRRIRGVGRRGGRREGDGVDGPVGPNGWKEGGRKGKAAGRPLPTLLGRCSWLPRQCRKSKSVRTRQTAHPPTRL